MNRFGHALDNERLPITPGLLIYPERIEHNIDKMIALAGDINRLIPHVKTHKMPKIVQMQMKKGIRQFKCATLSEIKMLIKCKVDKILLAHQPTAEKFETFLNWQLQHPEIEFSTLVDNEHSLSMFSAMASQKNCDIHLWIDINNGMNRTGIVTDKAFDIYLKFVEKPNCKLKGLHVYDGHIRNPDLNERIAKCNHDFKAVKQLVIRIEKQEKRSLKVIAGGSPSFYPHSLDQNVMLSPGTTLLWDNNYTKIWPESPFQPGALLITRLISKPNTGVYCFDLGHKAVASEMPLPRVVFFGLEDAVHIGQSEEHLVLEYKGEDRFVIGDLFYAIPQHICPTVAKYNKAYVVENQKITTSWDIVARDYQWQ